MATFTQAVRRSPSGARVANPKQRIAVSGNRGVKIVRACTIRFEAAPGDEGTRVRVQLEYDVPGGKLAAWLARLTGEEPGQQVAEALRRFKSLMEAGEIPTTDGQPVGEPQRSRREKKARS